MRTVTTRPSRTAFSRADLEAAPDDGRRYELIDGALIVTPAPSRWHQRAVGELYLLLRQGCPPDLEVLLAPFDIALADDTVMQPDLLVARRTDLTDADLPAAPRLAVEVLSPSTRRLDVTLKLARFEAAGCPSYWVVDPIRPALRAWELRDGAYVEVAHVIGGKAFRPTQPFDLTVTPDRLV